MSRQGVNVCADAFLSRDCWADAFPERDVEFWRAIVNLGHVWMVAFSSVQFCTYG